MMNSHHKEEGIQEKVIVQMVDVDKKHISLFSTHFKPQKHRQNTRRTQICQYCGTAI